MLSMRGNIVLVSNPLQYISSQIGSMMGEIMGNTMLVGLFAFFFLTALVFSLAVKSIALFVLEIPIVFITMQIGAFPAYIRLLFAIGIGIIFSLGFLRLMRR